MKTDLTDEQVSEVFRNTIDTKLLTPLEWSLADAPTIHNVTITGNDTVILTLDNEVHFVLTHERDCCETVEVCDTDNDDFKSLRELVGSKLISIEEVVGVDCSDEPPCFVDVSSTWTFYNIKTTTDVVQLRWFGTSNGYYSEQVDVRWAKTGRTVGPIVEDIITTTDVEGTILNTTIDYGNGFKLSLDTTIGILGKPRSLHEEAISELSHEDLTTTIGFTLPAAFIQDLITKSDRQLIEAFKYLQLAAITSSKEALESLVGQPLDNRTFDKINKKIKESFRAFLDDPTDTVTCVNYGRKVVEPTSVPKYLNKGNE